MTAERRYLIPFPAQETAPSAGDETVCSVPQADLLFRPAPARMEIPRTVSSQALAVALCAAFLLGAGSSRLVSDRLAARQQGSAANVAAILESVPALAARLSASPVVETVPASALATSPTAGSPALAAKPGNGSRRIRFDLLEAKEFQRVGPLRVRLTRTDHKRQTYTLTVLMQEKQVDLRDRALGEPVRFYVPGLGLCEVLARSIEDDAVAGVLRVPQMPARVRSEN